MRFFNYINEVYMAKSLQKDLDSSRGKGRPYKFGINVDGWIEEKAKTIGKANTLRNKWIKYVMQDIDRGRPNRKEAEKLVTIEEL